MRGSGRPFRAREAPPPGAWVPPPSRGVGRVHPLSQGGRLVVSCFAANSVLWRSARGAGLPALVLPRPPGTVGVPDPPGTVGVPDPPGTVGVPDPPGTVGVPGATAGRQRRG